MLPSIKHLLVFLLTGAIITSTSCKKDAKNEDSNPPSPVEIYYQKDDPRLADVTIDSNTIISFTGERDETGKPVAISMVTIGSKTDTTGTQILYEEQQRISTIYLPDGAFIKFSHLADSTYGIKMVDAIGNQYNTEIDASTGRKLKWGGKGTTPRNSKRLSIASKRITSPVGPVNTKEPAVKPLTINITKCGGIPTDVPFLNVTMYKGQWGSMHGHPATIKANKIATGIYVATLPAPQTPDVIMEVVDLCKTLSDIKDIKNGNPIAITKLILKLLKPIAAENDDLTFYNLIGEAEQDVELLDKAYKLIDIQAAIEDNVTDGVCKLLPNKELYNWGGVTFFIQAKGLNENTLFLNGGKSSAMITADAQKDFPTVNLELGNYAGISSILLEPESPSANQGYYASASFDCLGTGSVVTISVLGTDGYEDEYSHTISPDESMNGYNIQLFVPGALTAGIKDEITVTLQPLGKDPVQRMAYLVFQ